MDTSTFTSLNLNYIEHEGFYYIECDGSFYKGCRRCGGAGHYMHNGEHDRCYECNNTSARLGDQFADEKAAQKWCHEKALRRAQKARIAERKAAEAQATLTLIQEAVKAADEGVYEFLKSFDLNEDDRKNGFISNMAEVFQYVGYMRPFSPAMIAAVRRHLDHKAVQAAESAAHPAPSGRVAVTGEIVSTRVQESDYGFSYKILVKDDAGYKVWVSIASSLLETNSFDDVKGMRLTFTATLTPSNDDPAFAFGSRPTKASWI